MKIDTEHTLQDVLKDHKLWVKSGFERGSRAHLFGADLSRANLSRANLVEANLSGANLSFANLSRANLSFADLSRANLSFANLSRANLVEANLSGANLSDANLSNTVYENGIPIIINTEFYNIVKTKTYIKIGCETHTPEEWQKFTRWEIQQMDGNKALAFWKKYKKLVLLKV